MNDTKSDTILDDKPIVMGQACSEQIILWYRAGRENDTQDTAIVFATKAHSGSFRKGTITPYIVHPMEASAIVATMTDDKTILTAGIGLIRKISQNTVGIINLLLNFCPI